MDKSKKKIINFIEIYPAEYTVLIDTKMMSGAMYGVRGFPTTFLIDREGVINYKASGYREWSSRVTSDIIDKLIK